MDWLEKVLEDHIAANPHELGGVIFGSDYEISLLGRQVPCQYGIIDVLLWARNENFSYVLVVECKANHEKGLAVEQVSRYAAAVEDADMYDGLPEDAFPNQRQNRRGWMQHIEIRTIPIIVAPSFSNQLQTTYGGVLIEAKQTEGIFFFERKDGLVRPPTQRRLDAVLSPVIQRSHADAKAKSISKAFTRVQLGDTLQRK